MGNAKAEFLEKAKEYPQTGFFPQLIHLHNGYMQILVEVGLIGLLLFFLFIYTLLRLQMKGDEYILLAVIITIYLVGFVGEPLFFNRKPYLLFNLFIAILLFRSMCGAKKKEALE